MESDIRRAVQRAEGSAKINPKVNTSGLTSQAQKAGKEFGDRFSSSAKDAMKAISVAVVGAGIVDQFKQVLSVGMDWTNNMNTLQAVTGATADQLKAAGVQARALGNDISLPATSANDAAAAMTELAKGGFNVQQAMDATKGSLQLAAAAQIGAADAATIQSQALQAFGLQAGDAGKIADTLANAANASSAEITDVAQAMAQAGTVAKQFGLSAEDTAAAIGLLANNGIKGSDAGTLLKSTLLALTDQGKPAQGAIKELGLQVYDAQGKFVGLHALTEQLGAAAGNMTPEMYQAATATLFGSDAMRFAGVAAKDGSKSFDLMREAINRQGAASDVAAAKTRGLPGAWERVKNAIESLQLQAYDKLEGPVQTLLNGLSGGLGEVAPKLSAAWTQLAANPVIMQTWRDTGAVFKSLAGTAKEVWPSLVQIGKSLAAASGALGVSTWKLFVVALQTAAQALNVIAPVLSTVANLMKSNQSVVTVAAGAWLLFKTIPGLMARIAPAVTAVGTAATTMATRTATAFTSMRAIVTANNMIANTAAVGTMQMGRFGSTIGQIGTHVPVMARMQQAFLNTATSAGNFGRTAGVASAGMTGLRTAASGAVGLLGGPLSAALIGAGVAFAYISSQNQKSEQSMKAYQDAIKNTAKAQVDLDEALNKSGGVFDDGAKSAGASRISAIGEELDAASKKAGSFLDGVRAEGKGLFDLGSVFNVGSDLGGSKTQKQAIEDQAAAAGVAKQALDDLKLSNQSLTDVTYGGQAAFDALTAKLDAAGDSGKQAADKLREARKEFEDSSAASKNLTPGFTSIRDAIKTIGDAAATSEDKAKAFKTALDTLAGVKPDVQAATANYNDAARNVSAAAATPADAAGGPVNTGANGSVDTATQNGADLYEALKKIKDATADVAAAGGDVVPVMARNGQLLDQLATKYGKTRPEVDAYAASLGYIPKNVDTLVALSGATDVQREIGTVTALLDKVPPNTPVTVDAITTQAESQLKQVGAQVEHITVNGHAQVVVTAPNGEVLGQLDQIIAKIGEVNRSAQLNFNVSEFDNAGAAQRARRGQNADGSIVPMLNGGFRQIAKPGMADIYAGRGAGTVFAEQETGGEAYIPLAAGKRSRSRRILSEVARLFGMNVMEDGGITVDAVKAYASQLSGGSYVRGGPAGLDGTDCSGAQAAIANFITGGSGRFATGNEAEALASRGFIQGDPPPGVAAYWVGWKNGGPGGGHTAGTILDPNGGSTNVEMGGANGGGAFGGGAQGASGFPNRAWVQIAGGEDPNATSNFSGSSAAIQSASASVTSSKASVTSAQASLDQANAAVNEAKSTGKSADKVAVAEKKRDAAQQRLDAAQQRQTAAETKLADAKDKAASGSEKSGGGNDFSSLGSSFVSGIFESLGVPGFNNLLDSPNAKSAKALLNFGLGFLGGGDQSGTDASGGPLGSAGSSLGLSNLGNLLTPNGPQALSPVDPLTAQHGQANGAAPGPLVAYNGPVNMGVDPRAMMDKQSASVNGAYRSSGLPAVRPR